MSKPSDDEKSVGYNCDVCIAKDLMGKRRGRLCFAYQIDFEEGDELEYSVTGRDSTINGNISSFETFEYAITQLLNFYRTERIEVALKFIRLKNSNISGICPKSFPKSQLTIHLLGLLNLCMGGHNSTELVQLPYLGSILEQPNLFIEAYYIFVEEFNKWMKQERQTQEEKARQQSNETRR